MKEVKNILGIIALSTFLIWLDAPRWVCFCFTLFMFLVMPILSSIVDLLQAINMMVKEEKLEDAAKTKPYEPISREQEWPMRHKGTAELKRELAELKARNDRNGAEEHRINQLYDLLGKDARKGEKLRVVPGSDEQKQLRLERDKLLGKVLTPKGEARLKELDDAIGFVPFQTDPHAIQAETIIHQLAEQLRKQQEGNQGGEVTKEKP